MTDAYNHFVDATVDDLFPACTLFTPAKIMHLNTANALREEGITMKQCVGGRFYIEQSRARQIYIFHVEFNSEHATLEIDANTLEVLQLLGFNNTTPSKALRSYLQNWLESEKQRLKLFDNAVRQS